MGFFSWKTHDTGRLIANRYSERSTFPVTMIDDKGNRYFEPNYEGYGMFGGKDYYILLAEMNNVKREPDENDRSYRSKGIGIVFENTVKDPIFPNLVELPDHWTYTPTEPEYCEYQGFFYDVDMDDLYKDEENEYNEDDGYDLGDDDYDGDDGYDIED